MAAMLLVVARRPAARSATTRWCSASPTRSCASCTSAPTRCSAAATRDLRGRRRAGSRVRCSRPPSLLVVAGFVDGTRRTALLGRWRIAHRLRRACYVVGVEGWRVHAGHFAERFGLIIIIALGESIVALGVGAQGMPLDAG